MITQPQHDMLALINNYGDMPPDAEDVLGLHGAAFARVEGALIRQGYLNEAREITAEGWEAITSFRQRRV